MPSWFSVPSAMIAIAAIAAALSAWLTMKSFSRAALPGCGTGSSCDQVLSGRWARWGPIPVSVPATLLYIVIVANEVLKYRAVGLPEFFGAVATGAVFLVGASALWFIFLQLIIVITTSHARAKIAACAADTMNLLSWSGHGWAAADQAVTLTMKSTAETRI